MGKERGEHLWGNIITSLSMLTSIISLFIHSFIHYTQLSIFRVLHHFLESTEAGGICTAYCGTDGLEVTAHFVPTLSW